MKGKCGNFLSFGYKKAPKYCLFDYFRGFLRFVRLIGLEPTRPESPDPKSGASTNSATSAFCRFFCKRGCKVTNFSLFHQKFASKFYQSILSSCKIIVSKCHIMVGSDTELRILTVSVVHRTS